MPTIIGPRKLRERATLDAVEHGGETFFLERFGRLFGVLVPIREYEQLVEDARLGREIRGEQEGRQ